jgi:hypothetical protein
MMEWQRVIVSLLSSAENDESPYVIYPTAEHTWILDNPFSHHAAAKIAFDKPKVEALIPSHVFIWAMSVDYPSQQCCT